MIRVDHQANGAINTRRDSWSR